MMRFDLNLRAAVISAEKARPGEKHLKTIRGFLKKDDELLMLTKDEFQTASSFDMAFFTDICGSTPLSRMVSLRKTPSLAIEPYGGFHPYHAAFYRDIEKNGGIVLPANDPDEITDSIQAVRSGKALGRMKLIVADPGDDPFRIEEIKHFIQNCRKKLGVEIILRSTDEIKEKAKGYDSRTVDRELAGWYAHILEGPGEMDGNHMRQVARLYLAQRDLLEETGAVGITTNEIKGFLSLNRPEIMPNVSYGILVHDGYLVAEEGDIQILTTELLLYAGLGIHPTMSNIYLGYRDRFDALSHYSEYTEEMELEDFRQCITDGHLTAAHFSASGVLPPNMMEEERYRVRQALPAWPGQSMVVSTPKPGPLILARLSSDTTGIHIVNGEADKRSFGDQYGWYRGRWFIKLADISDFIQKCRHHHYALVQNTGKANVLETLVSKLLELEQI
jgi:hypothetical protein